MKHVCAVMVSTMLLLCSLFAQAQQTVATNTNVVVPPLVNFSGTLTDVNGKPLTEITGVTFYFYKDQQGGSPLWMETQNVQPDKTGHYSIMLGSITGQGLPPDLFASGQARWLAVQVQGQAEQPRIVLLSVPYALKAADAQTLGGLPPSAFVLAVPPSSSAATPEGATATAAVAASPLTTSDVTTTGGTVDAIPLFSTATNIQNSLLTQSGTTAISVGGKLNLPATGTATSSAGFNSRPLDFNASAFNSSSAAAVTQTFQWQAQPVGNDTSTPSASLNLLYASGTATPAGTGLKISSKGLITFATGQTLPTVTGNEAVTGNLSATGVVSGSSYQIGSNLFAFGSYTNENAFLGFAGNTKTTGTDNAAIGAYALFSNTTGTANTASGQWALEGNTTGSYNTASGEEALYRNTTGALNTAIGNAALLLNTMGSNNTAVGAGALQDNTTSNETAVGFSALYSNTTGGPNDAFGYQALYSNATGAFNAAFGYQALFSNNPYVTGTGSNNAAFGYQALYSNYVGYDNTASGYQALYSNYGAYENTAVGNQALYSNVGYNGELSSNYNTAVGYQALYSNNAGENEGGYSNTAVGIAALYSNTTGYDLTCIGANCSAGDGLSNATAVGAHAVVGLSNSLVLGGTGEHAVKVGIGTTTPSNILTIGRGTGHPVSDSWETYSSRRWKTNIHPLQNALSKVEQLRGVSYDLKDSGKHEIGVIAEEVGEVVPELVSYEENGKDARGVDYSRLTALLIEAVKQQQRQIQDQQAALRTQIAAIRDLKSELRATRLTLQKVKAQVAAAQPALVAAK